MPAGPKTPANATTAGPDDAARPEEQWRRLMASAQLGHAADYHRLLVEIVPYLRRLAGRVHRDSRDAEDAVQDILLTVHAVRHTYDPARPIKPWLVAIARRRIIDRLRVVLRNRSREITFTEEHETFSEPAENLTDDRPDAGAVRAAIARLPAGQQQAIRLLKLEEKSLKEASLQTGQSVVSLKVATHRAIRGLKRLLAEDEGKW
jgi:RNA polymerase sigma-70 factor, ECF subfamily